MGKKRKHQQKNNDEAIIETSETDSNFSPSKKQKHDECLAEEDIVHDWLHDDVVTLFNNIEAQLPQTDTIKSDRRLDQIDWELIKFKNFLPEECKDYAKSFIQKIRKYRTLSEVVSDAKFQLDNPNTDVKTGKVNYPDKPKKPTTAFFRYFIDRRSKYQSQNPSLNRYELAKLIANKFSTLSEKKKAKYIRDYEKEKAEYDEKMKKFRHDHPELLKDKQIRKAGPSKPLKPFNIYFASRSKKYDEPNSKETSELIRNSWNNLSDIKRFKWIKRSIQDQKRYKDELDEYLKMFPKYKPPKMKSILSKSEKELKNKIEGRPEKPPNSGYMLYSKKMLTELTDVPSKEKMVIIAQRWNELQPEEKEKFNEKASKMQAKYATKFKKYLQQFSPEEKALILEELKVKSSNDKNQQQNIRNVALIGYQMKEIKRKTNKSIQEKDELHVNAETNLEENLLDLNETIIQPVQNCRRSSYVVRNAKEFCEIKVSNSTLENKNLKSPTKCVTFNIDDKDCQQVQTLIKNYTVVSGIEQNSIDGHELLSEDEDFQDETVLKTENVMLNAEPEKNLTLTVNMESVVNNSDNAKNNEEAEESPFVNEIDDLTSLLSSSSTDLFSSKLDYYEISKNRALKRFNARTSNHPIYHSISNLDYKAIHIRIYSLDSNEFIIRFLWGTVEVRINFNDDCEPIRPISINVVSLLNQKPIQYEEMRGLYNDQNRPLFDGDDMFFGFEEKHRPILQMGHDYILRHFHERYPQLSKMYANSNRLLDLLTELSSIANTARSLTNEVREIYSAIITELLPSVEDKFSLSLKFLGAYVDTYVDMVISFVPYNYPDEVIHPVIIVPEGEEELYEMENFKAELLNVKNGELHYLYRLVNTAHSYIIRIRNKIRQQHRLEKQKKEFAATKTLQSD
ncbi:hypothetical protein RDWZM_009612 [Blomia tropicalis]|uniref:HMG box domain-containing protein n=1 Tax=Blomia tropicalis TaxID=40697 RepID=A0A9Q0RLH0_BLOTA|nr:hypothetical protein RDWZM_009612 [Blomia tropicalis]